MNLKELKEIIDLVTAKDAIEELEIEKSGVRLRIKRSTNHTHSITTAPIASASVSAAVAPATPAAALREEDLCYIKSPIVGTFYRAASPEADPFVSVGDFVEKGTPVCIIEAMKLMNEIQSEFAGEIVAILVENGQPVEYGENLYAVKPR